MLLAVPNVSEGRDAVRIARIAGTRAVDVHADPDHNRAVITYGESDIAEECVRMAARAIDEIDLRRHAGVHPRSGALDVLPFVPYGSSRAEADEAAEHVARRIADELSVPVYRYDELRALPGVRAAIARGGAPDAGPRAPHPTAGVACVGVRAPLVAFNVTLRTSLERAREIASAVRERDGGLRGLRALGFPLPSRGLVQVSMNLTELDATGPAAAFAAVRRLAGGAVVDAEVVGVVPEPVLDELENLPLRVPARSIEQALRG